MDQVSPGFDLCLLPAGVPPNGTISNFDNPQTLDTALISVCAVMVFGFVLFASCRLFANRRKLWWSDYFVIIAMICSLAQTGLMFAQTRFARHQWDVRACWYNGTYTKILFAQQMILQFVLFFSKGSIFLLFHQIFEVKERMRIAIQFGMVFAGLLYFTSIPVSAVLSAPHVGETWASVLISGRSEKELLWGVVQSALGILLDLFIFTLPIPVIVRLNLSTKKKVRGLAVFTTALVGMIASVLCLVYRAEAVNTNDGTWKYTLLLIFSVVENNVAIIVSCTPGFVNFTRVYVAELWIVRSFRSTFGGNKSSSNKIDPNQPRTRREHGRERNHEFDVLSDVSTPSTERVTDDRNVTLQPGLATFWISSNSQSTTRN